MEAEHTEAGDILGQIKELSNNFTPPEGACNTFRALYSKLEEYQNDLFQHIHLENNILFPKAIQFEKELLS
jgi:regulator of cell morphogenesis and NO signaling